MVRRRSGDPAGQSWATLLRNHAPQIAAMDLFVVPTIVKRVPIAHWTRICPYRVLFSGSCGLRRERSSAGCITNTSVSEFSVHTAFPEGFTAKCGAAVRSRRGYAECGYQLSQSSLRDLPYGDHLNFRKS